MTSPDARGSAPALLDADVLANTRLPDLASLLSMYAYPQVTGNSQVWVRANMAMTVDGSIAGHEGLTGSLNTAADKAVFALLRGLADVVLVGAGTARKEGYRQPKPPADARMQNLRSVNGQQSAPSLALVSRSLDVDDALVKAGAIVITSATAPERRRRELAERTRLIVAGDDEVDLPAALAALAAVTGHRVLCEGGPHLLAAVTRAGLLDELCLAMWPTFGGGTAAGLLPSDQVSPHPLRLAGVIAAESTLFTRWSR